MFSRWLDWFKNESVIAFIRKILNTLLDKTFIKILNKKSQHHIKTFQIFALRKRRDTFNNSLLSFKIRFLPLSWYSTLRKKKCYCYRYICFIQKSSFVKNYHLSFFKTRFHNIETSEISSAFLHQDRSLHWVIDLSHIINYDILQRTSRYLYILFHFIISYLTHITI